VIVRFSLLLLLVLLGVCNSEGVWHAHKEREKPQRQKKITSEAVVGKWIGEGLTS
jgi:hypothetical protein